jgi:hypothetical protein
VKRARPDAGGKLAAVGLVAYFLPSITKPKAHPQCGAIFVLNVLARWKVVGCVGAFIWAHTNSRLLPSATLPPSAPADLPAH